LTLLGGFCRRIALLCGGFNVDRVPEFLKLGDEGVLTPFGVTAPAGMPVTAEVVVLGTVGGTVRRWAGGRLSTWRPGPVSGSSSRVTGGRSR